MAEQAFAAGTVITSDYLPWARVLADSFASHNPGIRFVVALLDEPDPGLLRSEDQFDLVRPGDMGLAPVEYAWMTSIYDGFELSCAVKPWLLRFLMQDAPAALYFDSDIFVCDSLAEIASAAASAGLVLSPHTLEPLPADGLMPDDDIFLRSGQFNGGFVAVGRGGGPFLEWWRQRLARGCLAWSPAEPQRFVDQRWLDLAVNYFPNVVLRDRGANVAYWNLGTRVLEDGPDGYLVDGQPLRFFHFSGFEPAAPDVLSKFQGEPRRVEVRESSALARLCAEYASRLASAGLRPAATAREVAELAGGIRLTAHVRRALRAALIEAERTGVVPLTGPHDADALWTWLRAPVTQGGIPWYLWGLWASQSQLREAFALLPGADEPRYLGWAASEGVALGAVPVGLAHGASPLRLDGLRTFVALSDASEVISDARLLADVAELFDASDEITLLIAAGGRDAGGLARDLEPALANLGLDGPGSPDIVGLVDPAGAHALAPRVHAVVTRLPVHPALAHLPCAADATTLRGLHDAALSRRKLATAGAEP